MPKILPFDPRHAPAQGMAAGWPLTTFFFLAGCGGSQSSLSPEGPIARSIAHVSWIMMVGGLVITLVVMALALYAVFRNPQNRTATPKGRMENRMVLIGGVAWPVITLTALLIYGVVQMGDLRAERGTGAMQVEVTGNQWWWDIRYLDAEGGIEFTTANEIHVPAGVPVTVLLRSNDVIHSFWVPNLAGKTDLVPGRTNRHRIEADQPGVFRGQCAEFCGAQHARMALLVIAASRQQHDAWRVAQREAAVEPSSELARKGRQVFTSHCLQCHTVRGVGSGSNPGPDLTHVASRRFIAAGTLENNPANLRRFIAHSQSVKPGSRMPEFSHLEEPALNALVAYLEGLR